MSILVLILITVIWNYLKIGTQRPLAYLIIDMLIRAMEHILYLTMGFLFGLWLIEKAEHSGWAPSFFTKESHPFSDQENDILEGQQDDDQSETEEKDDKAEEDEDESEDQRMDNTASPRAYTWVFRLADIKFRGQIGRIYQA